ncbi:MAG: protein kinase [Myxococcales bacterium]|nr:protein kinase [Myxococcales bacterium]
MGVSRLRPSSNRALDVPPSLQPSDRFVVEDRVGGGASGEIFRAKDQVTGALVALKVLRQNATESEKARFRREIAVVADLRHPNIVDFVGSGDMPDGRLFLAMEWLDGEDLAKRQRRAPLGTRDAVEVVRRAAQALAAIHSRGIVHRDLKLSNLFLVKGRGTAVKLIDFGVVKPSDDDDFETETGTILGTPHYMAPEQARGQGVDARADVYALGSVLFRLLTGRNVFETEHVIALLGRLVLEDPPRPSQFRFDIPDKLDAVVHRAISRRPEDRYENAGEFARALARVGAVNNDPPQVERSASQVRPRRPGREDTQTGSTGHRLTRPGLRMRRVVACMLYDLGDGPLSEHSDSMVERTIGESLVDLAGEDVRIEQLAGGKTVAVLGVVHSRGDEVMRAARSALQMVREYPEARAVVAIGHAVMARSNLAGEALDRAARQLEKARPGTVRLDMHAAAALERRFEVARDTDGGTLMREDPRDLAPRRVLGQITPTVGREREIAELQSLYEETLTDSFPRAALLTGPPGIGKSRIRSELIQRLELAPMPPETLICRSDATDGTSVSALGKALRAQMGVQDGAAHDEQVQLVKRYVRSRLPRSLHFLAAFIGELVGVPFPEQNDEPLRAARANDQLMQSRIRMALEAYVRTQAGRIPQIIVLEDAHLADDTTIELLDWVLACPDIRLLVFAFAQDGLLERRPDLWRNCRLTIHKVAPLAPQMAERLVASMLPSLDEHARHDLVRRASGNPLVLEELARGAASGRTDLPLTVLALVQQRLDRLDPPVRETLRAAAVFGQVFWPGGISALLDRDVGADLEVAEREEVIFAQPASRVAGQREWMFQQGVVRDAAYSSLLDDDRQALHLSAGEWLEGVGNVDLGLIAGHFEVGGDRQRAAELYARATQQALGNFGQMEKALELARRGLDCGAAGGERALLLMTQAHVYSRMGRLSEGIVAAEQASSLVPPGSDLWVEAERLHSVCLIESGRAADGDARLSAALSGPDLPADARATLLAARVRGLFELNQPEVALSVSEQAVLAAQEAGRRGETAMLRALDGRAFALMMACLPGYACETGEALIEAADRAGDMHLASRGRINTASTLNYLGQYEAAQKLLERALPDVRSFRLRILEASCLQNIGMSQARLGSFNHAIELQREAARIADECGGARLGINCRVYEAQMLVWRGEPGDLRHAHALVQHIRHATQSLLGLQVVALFIEARVQLTRRHLDEALTAARAAHARIDDGPIEEWDEQIRLCLVEALLATGHRDEADAILRRAFEIIGHRLDNIERPTYRQSYATRNSDVFRLLELARERLGLTLAV